MKKQKQRNKTQGKAEAEPTESVNGNGPPDTSPDEQGETVDQLEFDVAVTEAKGHIWSVEFHERKIGELADRVEPKYGDATLEKFAEAIGLPYESVKRYRSTYRKYKDANFGETSPPSAGVLAALQGHPKRDEIIKEFPKLKVREARTLASDYRKASEDDTTDITEAEPASTTGTPAQGQVKPKEGYLIIETRSWFEDAVRAARATFKYGHTAQERLDSYVLTKALADPDDVERVLREGAKALTTLADAIKDALADARANARAKPKPPMFPDETARAA